MTLRNIYLFLAVAGSVIFVIQFLMTMFGGGGDCEVADGSTTEIHAHDAADLSGFTFVSLKTIVAFVTFFGWGGVFWGGLGWSGFLIAVVCGFVMMFMTALVLYLLLKLQESGNINSAKYLDHNGIVYLSIPGGRKGTGTVTVNFPGCTRQIRALADDEFKVGDAVRVVEVLGDELVVVGKV